MKKINILVLSILLLPLFIIAQSNYYYLKGEQIPIEINKQFVTITTSENFNTNLLQNTGVKTFTMHNENTTRNNQTKQWTKLEFINTPTNITSYNQKVNALKNINGVEGVYPYYNTSGKPVGTSNFFFVKLKQINDISLLTNWATNNNCSIIHQNEYMPLWYKLSANINNTSNSVILCNQLYETGLYQAVDPSFMFDFSQKESTITPSPNDLPIVESCTNDSMSNRQYNLFNNPEYPLADINICEAWDLGYTGNGVRLGVLDTGIDHTQASNDIAVPQAYTITTPLGQLVTLEGDYFYRHYYTNGQLNVPVTYHGTFVSGVITAKHNTTGISGVAPNVNLYNIANYLQGYDIEEITNAVNIATLPSPNYSVAVLNMSNGVDTEPLQSELLNNALDNALTNGRNGKGTIIVASSGNLGGGGGDNIGYPANYTDEILCVGSSNYQGQNATHNSYGNKLDFVTGGLNVLSYFDNATPQTYSGTSFSAPQVAGVAALMLEANPCLTREHLTNIMERTAQKSGYAVGIETYTGVGDPNGFPNGYGVNTNMSPSRFQNGYWYNQMGYGILDATACVKTAAAIKPNNLDLYIADSKNDYGVEPNVDTRHPDNVFWNSSDIWVRNSNIIDGIYYHEHENPEYVDANSKAYVNVKITNKSCLAYTGGATLEVYWSKASNSSSMLPGHNIWIGDLDDVYGVPMGGLVGMVDIPTTGSLLVSNGNSTTFDTNNFKLENSGGQSIISFEWNIPNPEDYNGILPYYDTNEFSFYAKIVSTEDPLDTPESFSVWNNAKNNNNIAWKNVTVIDPTVKATFTSRINISNYTDATKNYSIEFVKEQEENGFAIFEEAEVSLNFQDTLYQNWQDNGAVNTNVNEKTSQNFVITNDFATFDDITLASNEVKYIDISFNFLTDKVSAKKEFLLHFIQRDKATGEIVGGKTFKIKKQARNAFNANAGNDKNALKNQQVTLSAVTINEDAIYNWYDMQGNLIATGTELTVSQDVSKKYKLEIISTVDGFKDYDEVEVKVKPYYLNLIHPNPATSVITVNYEAVNASSAYIMLVNTTTGSSSNYIIDTNQHEKSIALNGLQSGLYNVVLVCNGAVYDTKTIYKN